MAQFTVTVQFSDVVAGSAIGTVTNVRSCTVTRRMNAPSTVSLVFADPLTPAIEAAMRATGNVLGEVLVGGVKRARFLVGKTSRDLQAPSPMTIVANTLEDGYDRGALIFHLNAYNVNMQGVVSQIMQVTPGLNEWLLSGELQFTARLDDAAQPLVVSYDIDTVSPIKALSILARDIGAALDPNQGQWWADSVANVINVGRRGTSPKMSFGGSGYKVLRHVTVEPDYTGMIHRLTVVGGSSNHGLPPGARCTGMAVVPGVAGVADAQFVAGFYATDEIGGVYYLTPDGNWHPLSQNMGVNALWYDAPRNILYAATPRGVYERPPTYHTGFFKQTGGYAGNVVDVFVDGVQVYAVCTGNPQGLNGLFTYPAINAVVVLNMGYDYWTPITTVDVVSASAFGTEVYVAEQGNPTQVTWMTGIGTSVVSTPITIPGGYSVTRLIRSVSATSSGTFVLTSGGSNAFFYIQAGGSVPNNLNAGGSLDAAMVNRVLAVPGAVSAGAPRLIATTNNGPYVSTGGGAFGSSTHWEPMCNLFTDPTVQQLPSGGLTDKQLTHIAVGVAKSAPDKISTPMIAAQDSTVYETNNSGKYWRDQIAQPVDPGSALRAGHVATGPIQWFQGLDGEGNTVYWLQRISAPFAPYGRFVTDTASAISTNNVTTVDAASAILVTGTERYLLQASTPNSKYLLDAIGHDDGLLNLDPCDLVNVTLVDDGCPPVAGIGVTNEANYVLEHSWSITGKEGTFVRSHTVAGNSTVEQAYTLNEIVSNLMYSQHQAAGR